MLRQAMVLARREGFDALLVVCEEDNLASAGVIERCGGVFEGPGTTDNGTPIRRYLVVTEGSPIEQGEEPPGPGDICPQGLDPTA